MHLENSACSPSFTKTAGSEIVPHLTHHKNNSGAQLKQSMNMKFGDIARPPVSIKHFTYLTDSQQTN